MSTNKKPTSSAHGARLLAVSCAVYLVAHIFGANWRSVPSSSELAQVDAKGQITLTAPELSDWYLSAEQREAFGAAEVEQRNRQLSSLEGTARTQLESYRLATGKSNKDLRTQLSSDLDQGRFAEALESWRAIESSTSPKTLASFGHAGAEKMTAVLTDLETLQVSQHVAALELTPQSEPGFLWTSPAGAPIEVFALASLAAIAALLTRRLTLKRRNLEQTSTDGVSALRHAAGPLLALFAWSLIRPEIEFVQVPLVLASIGIGLGFATPYLGRAAARLAGKDLEQKLRRSRSSLRKARILRAMKDLRPSSFADLKRAASQFAAEITATEVEEHPQS